MANMLCCSTVDAAMLFALISVAARLTRIGSLLVAFSNAMACGELDELGKTELE